MHIAEIIIAAAAGILFGLSVRGHQETCPRVVRGYDCHLEVNKACDHSRLALLQAELDMEQARIDYENRGNDTNFFGGGTA